MSLMNLLTAGRSLSEAREQPHRYKLTKGAFPNFGKPVAARGATGGEMNAGAVGSQAMKTDTVAQKVMGAAPSHKRWALPSNPFKLSRAPVPHPAVQGELSLDKVRPVRNDLSDSDLELVAAAKKPEATPAAVIIESIEVPVVKVKPLWERMRGLFQRAQ